MYDLLVSTALLLMAAAIVWLNVQVIKLKAGLSGQAQIVLALVNEDEKELVEWRKAAAMVDAQRSARCPKHK